VIDKVGSGGITVIYPASASRGAAPRRVHSGSPVGFVFILTNFLRRCLTSKRNLYIAFNVCLQLV
jgi:hypothetical protein